MTTTNPSDLPNVAGEVIEAAAGRVRAFPPRSNWASMIGHECERYLVWARTRWQTKAAIDGRKKLLFEGSKLIEITARDQLEGAGYQIIRDQEYFDWPQFQIGGKTDGMLTRRIGGNGDLWPLEIKGMQPFEWDKIDSVGAMLRSDKPWTRRYPHQMLAYLWMSEKPVGLFYLVNKTSYEPREIWVRLEDHLDEMEACLKKIERVNTHIAAGLEPEPMLYDEAVCGRCDFGHLCLPDRDWGPGVEVIDEEQLAADVARYLELRPQGTEYNAMDKKIKDQMKKAVPDGQAVKLVGTGLISIKWGIRHYKAQPAKDAHDVASCTIKIQDAPAEA